VDEATRYIRELEAALLSRISESGLPSELKVQSKDDDQSSSLRSRVGKYISAEKCKKEEELAVVDCEQIRPERG
jgi:hypothetical protein